LGQSSRHGTPGRAVGILAIIAVSMLQPMGAGAALP
jgi:hypothetical protein